MKNITLIAIGLTLALLCACATTAQTSEAGVDRSGPVCLSDYDIRSFNPVDDEFIYVEGRSDTHYLFTMQRGCLGLRSANAVGIPDRAGRICSNSLDDVIYRDISRGQATCRILDIEQVGSRDEARQLAEVRKDARREK
jgi:hypothetical protein